jgi:hypothetical protein
MEKCDTTKKYQWLRLLPYRRLQLVPALMLLAPAVAAAAAATGLAAVVLLAPLPAIMISIE